MRIRRGLGMVLVGLLSEVCVTTQAQSLATATAKTATAEEIVNAARVEAALEPIAEKTVPLFTFDPIAPFGTYWMLQNDVPPLPWDPFPTLMVVPLGGNAWLVDDRSVDYPALNAVLAAEVQARKFGLSTSGSDVGMMELDSGPPPPPDEGGGGGDTNDPPVFDPPVWLTSTQLCLLPPVFSSSNLVTWTWTNGLAGAPYDFFMTTNLAPATTYLNLTNWLWLMRSVVGQTNFSVTNYPTPEAYFALGTTNDSDADGLTDAYEALVSHGQTNLDSDGDGMPDAWEFAHGFNPRNAADANEDPDGDDLTNAQEYSGGTNPRDEWLVTWGANGQGQCNSPTALQGVRALDGGLWHTVVLRDNGTVAAWGENACGQTNVPADLSNVIAVAAGPNHNLALRADGSVAGWGAWGESWLANVTLPSGLTNIVAVAAGTEHDLAVRANGMIVAWSYDTNTAFTRVPTNLVSAKAVAAGSEHSVALLTNGLVVAWGNAVLGATNVPAGLSNVVAIAAGLNHTLALKADGFVVAWGAGTTNDGMYYNQGQSIVPGGLTNVVAVGAGGYSSMALCANGTVVAWGEIAPAPHGLNSVSAIGVGDGHALALRTQRQTPLVVQQPEGGCVSPGGNFMFAASGLGRATIRYQWQHEGTNMVNATNATLTLTNIQAAQEGNYRFKVSDGAGETFSQSALLALAKPVVLLSHTEPTNQVIRFHENLTLNVSVTTTGTCPSSVWYRWYVNGALMAQDFGPSFTISNATVANSGVYSVIVSNSAGGTNVSWSVEAVGEGAAITWGNTTNQSWEYVPNAADTIALAVGWKHALLLHEGGSVVAWGDNAFGQTNVPAGLSNVVGIAVGTNHSLALKADGTVAAWGINTNGQCSVPAGLTNVTAIAAAANYSLALLSNGRVTNWGNVGGTIPASLTNVMAIAAGADFSVALRSNGTVVAWGANGTGQTNVPGELSNVVAIAAGGVHALALRENGTVIAWGSNTAGQTNVPVILTNAMAIAAGSAHSLALRNDGTVIGWGDNSASQTNAPASLTSLKLIAAGGNRSYASIFNPLVQYPVIVSKDLLLIYNSNSVDSSNVCAYYLAHRPMVSNANVLPINCPRGEVMGTNDLVTGLETPLHNWLNANPTKHPAYIVLFLDVPSRMTNTHYPELYGSVSFALRERALGIKPFITHINMDGTNDCIGYINKLAAFGTNGQVLLSASVGHYSNTNFVFDNVRHGPNSGDQDYSYSSYVISNAIPAVLSAFPGCGIIYLDGLESTNLTLPHITNAVNVAGYMSWGFHSSLDISYASTNQWTGNSGWWLIETPESYNGLRTLYGLRGLFLRWFVASAFGGTNYSNTPIGGVTYTGEPGLAGVNDADRYFGLWAKGKNFAICAWASWDKNMFFPQVVGDPLVTR